jgi:putative alpha-1,2-mannosidase
MFPRRLDETDDQGHLKHWSPYDPSGGIHPGVLVTDNGFWDTFRTVYPAMALFYPDLLGDLVQVRCKSNQPTSLPAYLVWPAMRL